MHSQIYENDQLMKYQQFKKLHTEMLSQLLTLAKVEIPLSFLAAASNSGASFLQWPHLQQRRRGSA